MRYRKDRNEEIGAGSTVLSFAGAPLLYEPGTKWLYSTSMDWAGKLVERITGVRLEEYMKKDIWAPLGTTDITFWPETNPTLKAGKADMTVRNTPEGEICA